MLFKEHLYLVSHVVLPSISLWSNFYMLIGHLYFFGEMYIQIVCSLSELSYISFYMLFTFSFIINSFLKKFYFLIEGYNCFTEFCFLSNISRNQPGAPMSPPSRTLSSHLPPHPTLSRLLQSPD